MFGNKALLQAHKEHIASLVAEYQARMQDQERHYLFTIETLKDQIKDLRQMVFSPTSATQVPLVSLEADAILNQQDSPVKLTAEEQARLDDIESEANRILSGNY